MTDDGSDVDELRRRLAEAEDALQALRSGDADGLVDLRQLDGASVVTLGSGNRAYRLLIECMEEGAAALSAEGVVLYANPSLARILDVPRDQLLGRRLSSVLDGQDILNQHGHRERTLVLPSGAERQVLLSVVTLDLDDGNRPLLGLTAVDISAHRARDDEVDRLTARLEQLQGAKVVLEATEATLRYQATHDTLTGLPDRSVLIGQIEADLVHRSEGELVVVLYCDLDRFKPINDAHGHALGDQVLIRVASRLRDAVRPNDTVCRLSGDEFAVVARSMFDQRTAEGLAVRLVESVSAPMTIGSQVISVSASVGVALAGSDSTSAEQLLHDADMAMYRSKELGRNRHIVYHPVFRARQQAQERAERAIRTALRYDGVLTWFQPIVSLDEGMPMGMEALVRLQNLDGSIMMPGDFIPVAEDTDLIVPLGVKVLGDACMQMADWARQGYDLPIHVNLSARQVDAELQDTVESALERSGLRPANLRLELTETALFELEGETLSRLEALKELGVQLGLDDFGTGFASLTALRRVPVDFLKVDRTFVSDVHEDANAAAIVDAIFALGRSLGLETIAEGVETEGQRRVLADWGCEQAQGFLFSRPLSPSLATEWLRAVCPVPRPS